MTPAMMISGSDEAELARKLLHGAGQGDVFNARYSRVPVAGRATRH